jgi:hypothetical protein
MPAVDAEMSARPRWRRVVLAAAALAGALALSGCFDLELTLKLNSDGSGTLSTRAILSKQIVDLGARGRPPESRLLGQHGRVRRKSEIRNGELVQEEIAEFASLEDLRGIKGGTIEVTSRGTTFWGAERSRVRWILHTSKRQSDAPPPDPRIVENLVRGHILIVEVNIPCTVTDARDVKLNTTSVPPYVTRDVLRGSRVRWVVPLSALMATPNDKIVFDVECWSFAGIKPGKTPM